MRELLPTWIFWKEKEYMQKIVTELETPEVIKKRLETAFSILGDRIKYANPDCGLAFWPDQDLAFKLLENTAQGINDFNAEKRTGPNLEQRYYPESLFMSF